MTTLTMDRRDLAASGLDLQVLRQEKADERAAVRGEAKTLPDAQTLQRDSVKDQGQWRVLRYL